MSNQNFETNSYYVGGRHHSSAISMDGDIIKTVKKHSLQISSKL